MTLGLNWHLNPNMKVQWNYVWMDRDFDPPDDTGRREGSLQGLGHALPLGLLRYRSADSPTPPISH